MKEAVVNESLLHALVNDARAREKFGFLRQAHKLLTPTSRSCCGRRARSALNMRVLKTTVLGMAQSELQKLKDHLGVTTLIFFMPDQKGGTSKLSR